MNKNRNFATETVQVRLNNLEHDHADIYPDVASIQAESRNGVLKVRVPKTPAPKPRLVEVQVN